MNTQTKPVNNRGRKNNTKQKRRPRRRTRRPLVVSAPGSQQPKLHVSQCALDYLKALVNPWATFHEPPCIPDLISIPSYKYSTTAKITMAIGTGGVGWVCLDPWTMMCTGVSLEDAPLKYTTTTYAADTATALVNDVVSTPGVTTGQSNSPFTFTNVQDDSIQFRLVGGAIKLQYVGTNLNLGGECISYRSPGNVDYRAHQSTLLQIASSTRFPCKRGDVSVCYLPDNTSFLSYFNIKSYSIYHGGSQHHSIGFYVTGVPGNTYAVEAKCHFEMVGGNFQVTASSTDATGFAAVSSSVQTSSLPAEGPFLQMKQALQRLGSAFLDGSSYMLQRAAGAAGAAATQYAVNAGVRTLALMM